MAKPPGLPPHKLAALKKQDPRTCRELQFREGNYDLPSSVMQQGLRDRGLWELVASPLPSAAEVGECRWEELDCEDTYAVNYMLQYVDKFFDRRWSIKRRITGNELLAIVEKGCQPFRLMDLPKEIRDEIYSHWRRRLRTKREICIVCNSLWPPSRPLDNTSYFHRCLQSPRLDEIARTIRLYSLVCPEFRNAVNKIFYEVNLFYMSLSSRSVLGDVLGFSNISGMWRLRYLRNLKVEVASDCFYVTYEPRRGIIAEHEKEWDGDGVDLTEYCKMLEQHKEAEKWEGTGVIEFFTRFPDALRSQIYGPPKMIEDPNEEVNERDAYQVAFGMRQVVDPHCYPW